MGNLGQALLSFVLFAFFYITFNNRRIPKFRRDFSTAAFFKIHCRTWTCSFLVSESHGKVNEFDICLSVILLCKSVYLHMSCWEFEFVVILRGFLSQSYGRTSWVKCVRVVKWLHHLCSICLQCRVWQLRDVLLNVFTEILMSLWWDTTFTVIE